jgi:hypothetical protein
MSMPGIYLFAGAVILTMIANAMIEQDLSRDKIRNEDGRTGEDGDPPRLANGGGGPPMQPLLHISRES